MSRYLKAALSLFVIIPILVCVVAFAGIVQSLFPLVVGIVSFVWLLVLVYLFALSYFSEGEQ